ncbi:hypothetical protein ACFSHP_26005 [Novosphingobium panipatense]
MTNCVSAHILIGGRLARSRYPELIEAIKADNPAVDWDGTPFDPDDIPAGKPLALMDHDVANGCFEEIEGSVTGTVSTMFAGLALLPEASRRFASFTRVTASHSRS